MSWSDSFGLDDFGFGVDEGNDDGPGDTTPPVVGDFVPDRGTKIGRSQPLSFSVTDDSGAFAAIIVLVAYPTGVEEVVHDGESFRGAYVASVRTPIAGGYRFTLRRAGGWSAAPTIRTIPIDAAGNKR